MPLHAESFYISPNFDARKLPISMLVLHYTGMASGSAALERLCSVESKVSAHYVVEEDGTIYRLVAEENRAWHAGASYWRGITDVNSASIGIEIVNPGHEFGYRPFPEIQMEAVRNLCMDILSRYTIPSRNIVGHSDIAPERKEDPGELFNWRWLAEHNIGLWPESKPGARFSITDFHRNLSDYGYNPSSSPEALIRAFQRHFRPQHITGEWDIECNVRLDALLTMV